MPGNNNGCGPSAGELSVAFLPESDSPQSTLDGGALDHSVFEIELYKELSAAPDIAAFGESISAAVKRLGFSDFSYSRPFSQCEPNTDFLTVDRGIVESYCTEDFFPYDLNVQYARDNDHPIFQSAIEGHLAEAPFSTKTFRRCRDLYRMLRQFGYFDYYFIPTVTRAKEGVSRDRGLFAVTQKDCPATALKNKVERSKSILHLLADAIADIGALKFPEVFADAVAAEEIKITSRPLRLLTVLAQDDITLSEAADKLCISIHTANQHVAAARKAFGAHTTTGAVCAAAKAGLIKL